MKPVFRWLMTLTSLLLTLGLCGAGRAAVSDHVFRGQIMQGRIYDDPNLAAPLYHFMLELDTDASVSYVEFMTAAGRTDVIPADPHTVAGGIETYHWIDGSTHVWEYWGYFEDPNALHDYGDGLYVVIPHYANGSKEQTAVWYGVPGTTQPIPTPTQRPQLLWPPHDGAVASPVTFTWEPVTDPSIGDIYLNVRNDSNESVIAGVYGVHATGSTPYDVNEGRYQIEFALESFYSIMSPDGVPFEVLKTSTLLQPFEVVASNVYRFWSPITGRHFYTIDGAEKNKLIDTYSDVWTFEGPVFYAWATPYDSGMAPVYRFWSGSSNSHFYTIRESEKTKLINLYSHVWTYEGVAFYAYAPGGQPSDVSPVYRFWKPSDNTHFYTIDPTERDKLVTQYSAIYTFEGIAFYAWQ
jgi:hypothetical protein